MNLSIYCRNIQNPILDTRLPIAYTCPYPYKNTLDTLQPTFSFQQSNGENKSHTKNNFTSRCCKKKTKQFQQKTSRQEDASCKSKQGKNFLQFNFTSRY